MYTCKLYNLPCLVPPSISGNTGIHMDTKGIFSYTEDKVHHLELDGNLGIRIEQENLHVARVYLVDQQQVKQPVPPHITMETTAGDPIPPYRDIFYVTWIDGYTLFVNGQPYMLLNQQKQHAIMGPVGAAYGSVDCK